METNILLESGTNELEILEFKIGEHSYGINVAKIREILPYREVTPVPNSHPYVEGIFMPRDLIITIIDLAKSLHLPPSQDEKSDMFIVTNFNQLNLAFHVQQVVGIHRVSWSDIVRPDDAVNNNENGVATGIIKLQDKLIVILDFEKIVADISPETSLKVSAIEQLGERERNNIPILIADDSPLLNRLIMDALNKAGYTNVTSANNGQEAWDILNGYKENGGDIKDYIQLIVTDIEMPIMDGHRLAKLVRSESTFDKVPIVIFSSLINDEMRRKGDSLGVDAQLTKPEIGKLVQTLDELLIQSQN
ncbi:MAG: chemotaxis protein CheV [Lachnospiraceae bacterium]|nr:chemotaxis protein CheV [Lachnospiraceae bacterium]